MGECNHTGFVAIGGNTPNVPPIEPRVYRATVTQMSTPPMVLFNMKKEERLGEYENREPEMKSDHEKIIRFDCRIGALEKNVGDIKSSIEKKESSLAGEMKALEKVTGEIKAELPLMREAFQNALQKELKEVRDNICEVKTSIQKEAGSTTRWSIGTISLFGLIFAGLNVFGLFQSKSSDASILVEIKKTNAEVVQQMSQQNAALNALISKIPTPPASLPKSTP